MSLIARRGFVASCLAMAAALACSPAAFAGGIGSDDLTSLQAAITGHTDRLIIKYKAGTAAAARADTQAMARAHEAINRAGAQMRYLFFSGDRILGAIGFGASAWKIKARDGLIGWSAVQRRQRLHLVLNNSRFLIVPWVRCANLGSCVLGMCARRIPRDFLERYGYEPVLLETFVEQGRFRGSCYRAANWIGIGSTQGRGRMDRHGQASLPIKAIWVYPLRKDFRRVLTQGAPA